MSKHRAVYTVFAQSPTFSLLEVGREVPRKIYKDRIVEFEVQETRDRFG